MKKYVILFLYLFASLVLIVSAQNHKFKHFSTDIGLSSSEVYCIAQDNKGYTWFGTSRGLSMFDGVKFKNFSSKDGLPSNSIIKIFKDDFGRLWFSAFDGSLSYFENGKFFIFKNNDTLQKINKNYHLTNIFFDNHHNMWFTPAQGGIYYFDTKNDLHKFTPNIKYSGIYVLKKDGKYLSQYISKKLSDSIFCESTDTSLILYTNRSGFRYNVLVADSNKTYISLGNELFVIVNNKIKDRKVFDNEITCLYHEPDNIWVGVMQEGVYVYSNDNFVKPNRWLLQGITVSAVFKDIQKGYWLPTTENSIFYTPSFDFNFFTIPTEKFTNIVCLKVIDDKLLVSNFNKNLYSVSIERNFLDNSQKLDILKDKKYTINDIVVTDDATAWLLGKELISLHKNNVKIHTKINRIYKAHSDGSKIYMSSDKELKIFSKNKDTSIVHNLNIIVNAIYVDKNENIYLGTINGLYVFENSKLRYLGNQNDIFKVRINEIIGYKDFVVVATNGNGVYFYNPKTNYIYTITEENNLASNFVNSLHLIDSTLWIGTNKGLCRLNIIRNKEPLKTFIMPFNESDGLFSYEIKDIDSYKNIIFVGTSDGIYYFDYTKIRKNLNPPILLLDSIVVNDQKIDFSDNLKLKPNQNTISFHFKAISYSAGNKITYKYKLEGYDNQWNYTKDQMLRFPNLPSGEYKIIVNASTDGINWSSEPIEIKFYIKRKFTQTFIFYLLILILIFILASVILTIRYHQLRQDLRMRRIAIRSEQKALRSQMNPHFIFNALNSIRRYILESDTDKADFYLTRFAQLMRQVLENSKKEYISLEEEINTMSLYLELEKMRFDNSFVFEIEVDKSLNLKNLFLPTMIIQPIVENAIWHGLAPLQTNGKLLLKFEPIDDKSFVCIVDDNGIGRQRAQEIANKRKGHKSTGMSNLMERIELINQTGLKTISLEVIDKYDQNNNPQGTKVVLKFIHKAEDATKYSEIEKFLINLKILKK